MAVSRTDQGASALAGPWSPTIRIRVEGPIQGCGLLASGKHHRHSADLGASALPTGPRRCRLHWENAIGPVGGAGEQSFAAFGEQVGDQCS